jgi:hypothetical protein
MRTNDSVNVSVKSLSTRNSPHGADGAHALTRGCQLGVGWSAAELELALLAELWGTTAYERKRIALEEMLRHEHG